MFPTRAQGSYHQRPHRKDGTALAFPDWQSEINIYL